MTILILIALVVLAIVFAVFFLGFKLIWLLLKKKTNLGPLIGAGICTLGCFLLVTVGTYKFYRAVTTPFQAMMTQVKNNPAPIYGERTYTDGTYPFALTVYDGMDFSDWITFKNVQVKIGVDTNALKKDAAGKRTETPLLAGILRQTNAGDNPFEILQAQLTQAQDSRRIELADMQPTQINGLPAYQANGEAYSNQGKINFWITAVQSQPGTVYYLAALSTGNEPSLAEQAQQMTHSFTQLPASH